MSNLYDIIRTVHLSEKSENATEENNQYTFKVAKNASKRSIKIAVEQLFEVTVLSVNTINYQGKYKRMRSLKKGKRPDWKKAVVRIKDGESIDLF